MRTQETKQVLSDIPERDLRKSANMVIGPKKHLTEVYPDEAHWLKLSYPGLYELSDLIKGEETLLIGSPPAGEAAQAGVYYLAGAMDLWLEHLGENVNEQDRIDTRLWAITLDGAALKQIAARHYAYEAARTKWQKDPNGNIEIFSPAYLRAGNEYPAFDKLSRYVANRARELGNLEFHAGFVAHGVTLGSMALGETLELEAIEDQIMGRTD
jgi:hypothetical protein